MRTKCKAVEGSCSSEVPRPRWSWNRVAGRSDVFSLALRLRGCAPFQTHHLLVSLPGEFHGERSLVGYSPWGLKESDMAEQLTLSPLSS